MGAEAVSNSVACLWDPFPATGSPHPALVWWYVPRIIVAYYGMFGGQCPFYEGDMEWEQGEVRERLGGGDGGETVVRMQYM